MTKKPPVGVIAKWVLQEQRLEELCAGILRYRYALEPIPKEWLEEVSQLTQELAARAK